MQAPIHNQEEQQRPSIWSKITHPTTMIGKIGCGVLVVIWFTILTLPCGMLWLASGRTINIPHRDIPESRQHPLLEVRLIMDADNRGFQFHVSSIHNQGADKICVQSNISYFLWESEEEGNAAQYCDCYDLDTDTGSWSFIETLTGACTP